MNGIEVYPFVSEEQLITHADNHKGILVAVNAEKVVNASDRLRRIINSNIGYCDGMGAVKAAQKKGFEKAVRLPGCELWLKIIAAHPSATFYLIGSTDEVIEATVGKLRKDFPAIHIAGYRNGFFKDDAEKAQLLDLIAEKKPDYIFVAMGSPRQEYLMEEMLNVHKAVYQGLGGSFDLYVDTSNGRRNCCNASTANGCGGLSPNRPASPASGRMCDLPCASTPTGCNSSRPPHERHSPRECNDSVPKYRNISLPLQRLMFFVPHGVSHFSPGNTGHTNNEV